MEQFFRAIYYQLSPKMRLLVRKIFFFPIDVWKTLVGGRHKYEPPKGDIYIGSGDFIAQGIHHVDLLKKHIDLQPNDSVLDVGSGIGRTAVALTNFLSHNGRYEGFDVVEKGVKWCNEKIKTDFPNFNFIYVPLNNDLYNDHKGDANSFKFPYEDDTFDKVFLFSVFTHMSVEAIGNYLCEIKRVLKPEKLCFATFFIYDHKNEMSIAHNDQFSFPIEHGDFRLMNSQVKSANIAIKDVLLDKLISDAKLKKIKTIEGYWKKDIMPNSDNDFQDFVVLKS